MTEDRESKMTMMPWYLVAFGTLIWALLATVAFPFFMQIWGKAWGY